MTSDKAERTRDVLLVVLAVAAGATDATAFDRLGHVFASVITGNLVLLGVSAVSGDGRAALFAGCALGGYALGVLLAAPRGGEDRRVWPPGATLALGGDFLTLVGFAVGWELVGGRPSHAMQLVLLVLCAGAMGMQSAAVRRLGQMSTTYLTSTLTGLVEALAVWRWSLGEVRSLAILLAAAGGAGAALALLLHAHVWLPVMQLVPLAVVLVGSRRLIAVQPPA